MNFKGKFRLSLFKKSRDMISLSSSVLQEVGQACYMYSLCVKSLTQLMVDILIGLGCNGSLVPKMWHFIWLTMGLNVETLVRTINTEEVHPLTQILIFACQVTLYLIV